MDNPYNFSIHTRPIIFEVLKKEDYQGSINSIQRIIKEASIRSFIVEKYRPTPTQQPIEELENIIKQDFSTTTINVKWLVDITNIINLHDGRYFLASVLNLYTKKIIGYKFSHKMTGDIILEAMHVSNLFMQYSKKKRFIEDDIKPLKMQESHYFNISKICIIANEFIVELVTSLQMNSKRCAEFQRKN